MFALEPFEAEYGRLMDAVEIVQVMGCFERQTEFGAATIFLFVREDGTFGTDDINQFTAKMVRLDAKEIDSEEE